MTSPYDECPSLFPRAKNSANNLWPRDQGWTYAGCQVAMATKFYMVAINNCRSSVRNLLHVTHLGPRILSWRLTFCTFSAPLLTTKELIFTEIPGLSPYSKRDKNFDNRQCVNMLRREAVGTRNDPVVCQDYTDSMVNEIYTNTEHYWNYTDRRNRSRHVEKKTVPVPFFQHLSYVDWSGIKSGSSNWQPVTTPPSCNAAFCLMAA
jgi:hypothetical protein